MYWDWILVGSVTFIALAIVVLVGVVGMSILALSQLDDGTTTQVCEGCGCPTNHNGQYTDDEVLLCGQCYDAVPIQPRWNRTDFGAVERRARLRKLQGGRQ